MSFNGKVIAITGGVISGLGKGVTLASIGHFFSKDYNISPIKLDGYLNSDPGTMNPIEHGEVFVLNDGHEVDMDFGHYERFIGCETKKSQSITMGKIFKIVRDKERNGEYLGKTVQMIPHVTDLIQEKILKIAEENKSDLLLVEVGGTVGDIENELYIEALRQLQSKVGKENMLFIHLTYVPIPFGVNEQKTKPTQQSVNSLRERGIWPEIIIARSSELLTEKSKDKIALFANIDSKDVFTARDLKSVYELPLEFEKDKLIERICEKINVDKPSNPKLDIWNRLLSNKKEKEIKILIAGKYTKLEDSYASVVESLKHCEVNLDVKINIDFIDTSNEKDLEKLNNCDGIIVPGGFGERGIEGKINVIKFARENKIPYLGICYGLQLAVIEFARNVCGIKNATTLEIDKESKEAVITLMDEQKNVVQMGGTMRLGKYDAKLQDGIIKDLYNKLELGENVKGNFIVNERHRHRFEVNPNYVEKLSGKGLIFSGLSLERDLVEFIELDKKDHPYFVATQAHPELKSKLEKPAPLFYGLVEACLKK